MNECELSRAAEQSATTLVPPFVVVVGENSDGSVGGSEKSKLPRARGLGRATDRPTDRRTDGEIDFPRCER